MTEVGMALSCGLSRTCRLDGSVGWPLPSVDVRLADPETNKIIEEADEQGTSMEGEIQLRGPTVFTEYWRNESATQEAFVPTDDGGGNWFKTGDIAVRRSVPNINPEGQDWIKGLAYFILGRKSTDIIKTGGEKVSALEIEREILSLPQIAEAAVVGLPNERWGQKVCAVVVLKQEDESTGMEGKGGKGWGVMDMRRALKERLATHKIPQELRIVEKLGKNAMGKGECPLLLKMDSGEGVKRLT